jgi:uncharacterized protein (DUF1778 family)
MTGPRRRRRGIGLVARKVEVRLSPDEYATIKGAAAAPGRGVTLSRYIAEAALAAAGTSPVTSSERRPPSQLVLAEVMDAVTAVNRVGNNLNQLAREKNITGLRPVGTLDEERRARAALGRLAEAAERAAGGAA